MGHLRRGERIEGYFVFFLRDFVFEFTVLSHPGMVSGEAEIYVCENEISEGKEIRMKFYPMKARIRVAWIGKDHQAHAAGGHCKLAPWTVGYGL